MREVADLLDDPYKLSAKVTSGTECGEGEWKTAGVRDDGRDNLPFAVGERLTFRARAPRMGMTGHGTMWIEGPVTVRGRST